MNVRHLIYFRAGSEAGEIIPQLSEAGWQVYLAESAEQIRRLVEQYDIGVGLVPLPAGEYLFHEKEAWQECGKLSWVALVPRDTPLSPEDWSAIATYVYDYHTLPVDRPRLLVTLGHAEGMVRRYREQYHGETCCSDYEMVGESRQMRALFSAIRKVAAVDAPVLINGESGTGKELAARAIHDHSQRTSGPFVAVNCGALPSTLIQSELFGHEKGAFTGADQRKIGFIEKAESGTLFLDEIGDLPLDLQVNLLRFIQEQTIERVGGREPIKVDVRVVAATNVNLEDAVAARRFRDDLYFRLHVLVLTLPPLREREQDVELLAKFFFHKFAQEQQCKVKGFSAKSLQAMRDHHWPGNVREMINRVRRAMVMTEHRLITPVDLGLDKHDLQPTTLALEKARVDAEIKTIRASLKAARNNISRSARNLGVSRVTLYRLMAKHNIVL